MAQPTETFDAYDAIGNREDLSNIIHNISPTLTPFQNNVSRGTASNILHEWQTEELDPVDPNNAHIDGDDATGDAINPTVRVNNQCQILRKVIVVSGRQNASDSAGRKNELAHQIAKKGKEMKRDKETILLSNQAKLTGTSAVAALMAGIEAVIETNTNRGVGGVDPSGYGTVAAVDGTQRPFTELLLKDVLQQCYITGAEIDMLMVGPNNKQVASSFAGIATLYRDTAPSMDQASIIGAADVYVSDFGELKIVPNRFQRDRTAILCDTAMASVDAFRPLMTEELAKTGDSEKRYILEDCTLKICNESAFGIIADLDT